MQEIKSIHDIAQFLEEKHQRLKPLPFSRINLIENTFKVSLPGVYKEFLQLMGIGAGKYMLGSSVFYDELFSLKEWTEYLIAENGLEPIPDNAFVFWMHQGYQAAFFKINEGDDPPVYHYSEGDDEKLFELKSLSLTGFFLVQLKFSYPEIELPF